MITYIFLDIDGVLRKKTDPKNCLNPDLVKHLFPAVNGLGSRLVISSTWRVAYSLKELKRFFPEPLQDAIVGITPEHPDLFIDYGRERECMAWLRANAETPSYYVGLDDDASLYKSFPLVEVDPSLGIQSDVFERIRSTRKALAVG